MMTKRSTPKSYSKFLPCFGVAPLRVLKDTEGNFVNQFFTQDRVKAIKLPFKKKTTYKNKPETL